MFRALPPLLLGLVCFYLIRPLQLVSPLAVLVLLTLWFWFHRAPLFAWAGLVLGATLIMFFPASASPPSRFYALGRVAEIQEPLGKTNYLYRIELRIRPKGAPRCIQVITPQNGWKVGSEQWLEVSHLRLGKLPIPYASIHYPERMEKNSLSSLSSSLEEPPLTPARAFYEGILHNRFMKRGEEFREIRWIMDAGLAHLMSISGIHIGFFLLFFEGIFSAIIFFIPWRVLPFIPRSLLFYGRWCLGLLLAVLYLFRIGLPPASVRSLLWILVIFFAARFLRVHLAMDTIVILIVVVTSAFAPCFLPTLSFALSLTAMIYLIPLTWVESTPIRIALGCILPWLGTFPLLCGFTYVSLTGPVANLIGIPFFGLWIFPWAWVHELTKGIPFISSLAWDLYSFGFYLLANLSKALLSLHLPALPGFFSRLPGDLILFLCALPLLIEGFWRRYSFLSGENSFHGADPTA